MIDQDLIQAVKEIVLRFDPSAQVILYGSRARGDAQPDSDWDFLVLLDNEPECALETAIERALYRLEIDSGALLNAIIHSKAYWQSQLVQAMPFHENVEREGVAV